MAAKQCPRCQLEKPVSGFWKSKNRPGGYCSYCKLCSNTVRNEKYRSDAEYRNKRLEAEKIRGQDPVFKQKRREYNKVYQYNKWHSDGNYRIKMTPFTYLSDF